VAGADVQTHQGSFKYINKDEEVKMVTEIEDVRKFTDCTMVSSLYSGIQTLVAGTQRGILGTYSPELDAGICFSQLNAHVSEIVRTLVSPDGTRVFSAGKDGAIFVYSVLEFFDERTRMETEIKEEDKPLYFARVHDKEIANIVLVEQHLMEEWRA